MTEWQKIETAPKDGANILIVDMTARIPTATLVHYRNGLWFGCANDVVEADEEGDALSLCGSYKSPTHWMPLPEPPAQEEG